MSNLDGLAMLGQQRAKASRKPLSGEQATGSVRRTLPPRHPAPAKKPTPPQVSESFTSSSAVLDASAAGAATPPQEEARRAGTTTSRETEQPLIRSTLYVDADLDSWLQTVSGLGRSASPRVDITRSAVVRFALERLRAEMPAPEIFAALVSRAGDATSKGGRKRI